MKRIISAFIIFAMFISLVGCESSSVKVSLEKGEIPALSDKAFSLNLETNEGAPTVSQATIKADPDDSIMVAGKGFSDEALKVFVCDMASGKTEQTNYTVVDDNLLSAVIPEDFKESIFAVYTQNEQGFSNHKLINSPKIWYVNFVKLTADEEFSIYGENFVVDENIKPQVFLVSEDGYFEPEVVYADPYKITVKTPDTLSETEKYDIYVYNGLGGKHGVCKAEEKITYSETPAVVFEGKVIDVTDFGADARSIKNDDTKAVKEAISEISDGDTLYFPKGYYLITEDLNIEASVKIIGDGAEKSVLLSGHGIEKSLLTVKGSPVEIADLGLEHKKTTGKITTTLLSITGDSYQTGTWGFYLHDCKLVQNASKKYISRIHPIDISNCNGIKIENNYLDTFGFMAGRGMRNTVVQNNTLDSNFVTGYYYGQDSFSIGSANGIDISNNILQGKGAKEVNPLGNGEYTAGRTIVFHQVYNVYTANNTLRKSGIPHCNAGEMFLLENLTVKYDGFLASADGNTITLPQEAALQFKNGDVISVVSGEGKYQYRTVVDAKNKTATLDTPFDVVPNTDSRIIISHTFKNVALYNNVFDGYSTWQKYPSSTVSLQAYGSIHNLHMEKNTFKNLSQGMEITPYYYNIESNDSKAVIAWCSFDDNSFENMGVGVQYNASVESNIGPIPANVSCGIVFRRNSFKNIIEYTNNDWIGKGGYAIVVGPRTKQATGNRWQGDWINGVLFENSTFEDIEKEQLSLGVHQNNVILRNNGKISTVIHEKANSAVETDY